MPTTREDITRWFEEGVRQGKTHLIVVCDEFDYEDFPVYTFGSGSTARALVADWNAKELHHVMEVYDLSRGMHVQLQEHRAWNFAETGTPLTDPQPLIEMAREMEEKNRA